MSSSAVSPMTKNARHQRIIDLVTNHAVRSQTELAELLAQHDVHVTQATLSRDLVELDAVKVRSPQGALVYAVPAEGGDRSPTGGREIVRGARAARATVRGAAGQRRRERQPRRPPHTPRRGPVPGQRLRQGRPG